ncbi:SH3 domain-containing protein [Streptomyces nanshensis]|uniref:SH3 domain-containing protein n=1 Tax=Streptomyces nanshensis TaxID=518642 RepID=UPI00085C993C|nr:SH3 domain-containing protein [Streptomyces nanshensis]
MTRLTHRLGTTVAASALLVGGAAAAAPAASAAPAPAKLVASEAASPSADFAKNCRNDKNHTERITSSGVNLRKGPSTGYASKGQLSKNAKFRIYGSCGSYLDPGPDKIWYYGKVLTGKNHGLKGWVSYRYTT